MDKAKWAAQNGDIEELKQEVAQPGFNVNADVTQGRTLLHCAADYGQVECIEILLSNGANIDAKDKHGITPLLNAIWEGHTQAVKLLLAKGADKTVKAPSGESTLECAENEDMKALLR